MSHIDSFLNFAQKSEVMKRLHFNNEEAFLKELDGKVYAVCDKNGRYLCDVTEDDYLRLLDAGILVNLCDNIDFTDIDTDCDVILTLDLGEKGYNEFREKYGLLIDIKGEKTNISFMEYPISQEIDNILLKSSVDESETSFVFMDGIAIQIESLESPVPIVNPIILTYPHKREVFNNVRMRDEIENYRGLSWDGDYFSIALVYGKERKLS